MRHGKRHGISAILTGLALALGFAAASPALAQAPDKKPNILFIMGDDIGIMNVGAYHQGLMVGETPNIDRLGKEGAKFMTYYAEQSCTAGRTAFFTGMHPLRAGMVMPQLPGARLRCCRARPRWRNSCWISAITPVSSARTTWAIKPHRCQRRMASRNIWGYLYHLDAMQGVSFPDINKTPTDQAVVPPCKNTPIKGLKEVPGAVDPRTALCMTPPRPVLHCTSSDGTEKNQSCKDDGAADAGTFQDR